MVKSRLLLEKVRPISQPSTKNGRQDNKLTHGGNKQFAVQAGGRRPELAAVYLFDIVAGEGVDRRVRGGVFALVRHHVVRVAVVAHIISATSLVVAALLLVVLGLAKF